MKKLMILLILIVAMFTVAAVFAADEETEPATKPAEMDHAAKLAEMDGKEIYKGLCKTCHGEDAEGEIHLGGHGCWVSGIG